MNMTYSSIFLVHRRVASRQRLGVVYFKYKERYAQKGNALRIAVFFLKILQIPFQKFFTKGFEAVFDDGGADV